MQMRIVNNNIYKGRKVNEIAKVGLSSKEDVVLLFRELRNSYPSGKWEDPNEDEMCDLVRLLDSQTDHLLKGAETENLSKEELREQKKDEERILNFYKDDIKELFTTLSKVDF